MIFVAAVLVPVIAMLIDVPTAVIFLGGWCLGVSAVLTRRRS